MLDKEPAFLLTRHWSDTPRGVELVFWVKSSQGPLRLVYPQQKAICFIAQCDPLDTQSRSLERKPLSLTNMNSEPVDGLYFHQQRQLQQLRNQCRDSSTLLLESDIKPSDRFLMERFITAPLHVSGKPQNKVGYCELINPTIRAANDLLPLTYLSLDIETKGYEKEILSIAFCNPDTQQIFMQGGASDWPSEQPISWYPNERELLIGFLQRFQTIDPDLILGWNVINFDLDLLEQRCRHYRVPFTLGRGGMEATILQPKQSGQVKVPAIPGRVVLDGIDNLKAAFWSFSSFTLGHVASELLGRTKLIESDQDKVAEILRLFNQDRSALAAYNLEDCRLVEAIFEKTDLLNFALQRAVMTGLPLGRQGGSVAAFDNLYLPKLHRAGVVAYDIGSNKHTLSSPGGYVMDSQPGLYNNVLVLDFKSLYPSIICTFKIDPYGLAFSGETPIPGFLEAQFRREGSILPSIIEELWHKRDQAKQNRDNALSQAIKIIMNSFYGVLGSSGCRFYDPKLASSITRRGHEIIQRSRDIIETQGYQVIYGDTDSVFVLLGDNINESEAAKIGQQLATKLNDWWSTYLQSEFNLSSALEIEFETHFLRFLMPTIRGSDTGSKKRYAGVIRRPEGDTQIVFKGLESVRSDWTELAKLFQQELYQRIFSEQPYREYITKTVNQLKQGALDSQLIYKKRLRRKLEEYQKNIPPHVQAARKLKKPGRSISYIITLNGPEPIAERHSRIDYQHYIDRQLEPVADGILHFVNDSFEQIVADQMSLFD